ncbi:MAG TPA: hypothetical protein DCE41_35400, partial [Cytophagales bacterium]|nr:hypothetical protein [Cytophagales bacterium]
HNRVAGLDFNLRSADDSWRVLTFYHRSFDSEVGNDQAFAHGAFVGYNHRNFFIGWNHEMVGENYNAATGFVRRTGYLRFEPFVRVSFFPQNSVVQQHGPRLRFDQFADDPLQIDTILDRRLGASYRVNFLNTSEVEAGYDYNFTLLFNDFDPANTGSDTVAELPAGSAYNYHRYFFRGRTDRRNWWNLEGRVSWGQYFNGTRVEVQGSANMRLQPYANLGVNVNYNRIRLPEGFASVDYWLIAPRLDVTFSDEIFWTTFVQLNGQNQNLGLNTRLQWRYAPVSDFFLVYTDNYNTGGPEWIPRQRGIVAKLTYWLNI